MNVDLDWAWAAGLFEGEGCATRQKDRERIYLSLVLSSTDEDIVRRFSAIVGEGKVHGPYSRANRKDTWRWMVTGSRAIVLANEEKFISQLGIRRRSTISTILSEISSLPPLKSHRWRTECKKCGHPWDENNTISFPSGRKCRNCRTNQHKRYWREFLTARDNARIDGVYVGKPH